MFYIYFPPNWINSFKSFLKTAKSSKGTAFSSAKFFSLSSIYWNLFPLTAVLKKSASSRPGEEHGVAYLCSTVSVQKCLHCQCGMRTGTNCSKLWPHPRNALQQSSDINVESAVDSAFQTYILYESHVVCQNMCSAWFWAWTFANETSWALKVSLRSTAYPEVSSLGHVDVPMTHSQL